MDQASIHEAPLTDDESLSGSTRLAAKAAKIGHDDAFAAELPLNAPCCSAAAACNRPRLSRAIR